ncbi:MAG: type II toxin-antitoxin system ParD family antitoxin [Verrucomicrobiaceae bacterium]|nr:MAG: type II toxin-antitoxin system ParD family antitoxin [Verrucomicrobiaceae bacterium]
MATMNVSLPEVLKDWAESRAGTGDYSNTSDYVRDLIRRDRDHVQKIAAIQALVSEGLESGISELRMAEIRDQARRKAKLD